MAEIFNEITDELQTISKLADRPEISAAELKAKFDSDAITLKNAVNKLIELLNATIEDGNLSGQQNKIPTSNAVAQAISIAGGGDMLKSVYDADGDNIVDDAKKLGGIAANNYLKKSAEYEDLETNIKTVIGALNELVETKISKSGGTMTGDLNVAKLVFPTGGLIGDGGTSDAPILIMVGTLRAANVNSGKYDLGGSSAKWRNLYLSGAVYAGTIITTPGGGIKNTTAGSMIFNANSEANNAVFFGVRDNAWTFCPYVSGKVILGSPSYKWGQIYSTNSAISTSDENEKNSIKSLDKEKASEFINGINPISYKFNDGTSGRTHWGMGSQSIEKLMESLGLSSLDFAGFIKSPKTQQVEIGKDENGEPIYEDKVIEGEYAYGLRYEEFIAPMIATIQYQQQQIDNLTKRVEALEGGK